MISMQTRCGLSLQSLFNNPLERSLRVVSALRHQGGDDVVTSSINSPGQTEAVIVSKGVCYKTKKIDISYTFIISKIYKKKNLHCTSVPI